MHIFNLQVYENKRIINRNDVADGGDGIGTGEFAERGDCIVSAKDVQNHQTATDYEREAPMEKRHLLGLRHAGLF
jgi:hypothetical protein